MLMKSFGQKENYKDWKFNLHKPVKRIRKGKHIGKYKRHFDFIVKISL